MPSETDASTQQPSDLPDSAVRAQLERILASEVFSRSQQLRRFLSFIVEQRLAGQGHSLKESVLAHELYGKGTDFDGGDRSRRSGGRQAPSRQTARVLRGPIRSRRHLAAEGQLRTRLRSEFRLTHPRGSSGCSLGAAADAAGSELQAREDRRQRSGGRRCGYRRRACLARTQPVSAPAQLLPLASYPGVEGPPALSPDGNLVAFAWSGHAEAGPTDIYVKAVESEALRRLTANSGLGDQPGLVP